MTSKPATDNTNRRGAVAAYQIREYLTVVITTVNHEACY